MGYVESILNEVRSKIAPSDETLSSARARRDEVLAAAKKYHGTLRTYLSGSIAHGTANDDTDADCGIVLDRRSYPALGPDGDGEGPNEIVEDLREFIRDSLKENHDEVRFFLTKRAIKVSFNEPLQDGTDPSVDLIVALTRMLGALWIPNREQKRWDASDPEKHTELLTGEPAKLRRTRARIIRLAKAWNKQFSIPGLCSFNIEALALQSVTDEMNVANGLAGFFSFAAGDLKKHLTPDPAGVSPAIKTLVERDVLVERLDKAANKMVDAVENADDERKVREHLADVFWKYVEPPVNSESKAAVAAALRQGNQGVALKSGALTVGTVSGHQLKTTRSFGEG